MHIYPDYYEKFKCIADRCKHNCCIGWEIDIDEGTLGFYKSVEGNFGKRLHENIEFDETPHFKLNENERCPFLNDKNLCDIIITLGEEKLCDICTQHPRFHNELPDRIESGLGLCCEEAGRLILSQKEKMTLIGDSNLCTDDEIILLRDKIIKALQNRDKTINERLKDMLALCNAKPQDIKTEELCDILSELECMDEKWTELLAMLKENCEKIDIKAFDECMSDRAYEYEQFCVYLIYRHFANSPDMYEAANRASFVALAYSLIHSLGAVIYSTTGKFDFETQVDIARLFSSEIEYSDENLYTLFDMV